MLEPMCALSGTAADVIGESNESAAAGRVGAWDEVEDGRRPKGANGSHWEWGKGVNEERSSFCACAHDEY